MSKAYLLVICLLASSFTGCLGSDDNQDKNEGNIEETIDEPDSTVDETNNTEKKELVKGCMDMDATNYNSTVEIDDGSCEYLEGYSDKNSYYSGEIIELYVSASVEYNLDIYKGNNEINSSYYSEKNVVPLLQNYSNDDYKNGCNWKIRHQITILENWSTGVYVVELTDLTNSEIHYIPFIVKDRVMKEIVFLASTNTWQAYNKWGGAGYYSNTYEENKSFVPIVSFHRPYYEFQKEGSHLAYADILVVKWLEENNRVYSVISDYDLHENNTILNNSKILILGTHPEYWSFEMRYNLDIFLKNGGNLIFLGANGIYWKITYSDDGALMEVRKDYVNHTQTDELGGKWRDLYDDKGIELNEAAYLGVAYTREGYGTYAPYKVYNSTHWIYNNTNLKDGDLVGAYGLFDKNKDGIGDGASGWETDKINAFSPNNITILGIGDNKEGGANMIYFENNNSKVFSVGSITFVQSLVVDKNLTIMLNNILDKWLM